MGGVDEQVRLFHNLMHRVRRIPRVGAFGMAVEEVIGELPGMVRVPEDPGLNESIAEFLDDHIGIGRDVE